MIFSAFVGLAGFLLGAILHLYLFSLVLRRSGKNRFERVLLCLLAALLVWYVGNFLDLLFRQAGAPGLSALTAIVDSITFTGLASLPAVLVHTHWTYYTQHYGCRFWEKWIVLPALAILYGSLVALPLVWAMLFGSPEILPLKKLAPFSGPFLILLGVSYYVSAFLGVRLLSRSANPVERGLFRGLVVFFLVIPWFNFYVFSSLGTAASAFQEFLVLLAFLGSTGPASIVAYYIYKYRFLDIQVPRGMTSGLLVVFILAAYVIGVRRLGQYVQEEMGVPPYLVEGTFLLALLLFFPGLSRRLENRVARLFSGEIRKYREVADAISRFTPTLVETGLLKEFIEEKLRQTLGASRVQIHLGDQSGGPSGYPLESGGKRVGFLEVALPDFEFSGEREAMKLLASDIAASLERSQLLESKLKMELELAQKSHMEDLGRLAATVAHNVKNPLSSMKTLMQLLRESSNLTQEQRQEVEMIIAEVDRLAKTVSDLLKFSRLESRAPTQETVEIDLRNLLVSLEHLFRGDLESCRINLDLKMELDQDCICSNPEALLDILTNLLSNAVEATPAGKRIMIEAESRQGTVVLIIEDEGPGIPSQVKDRIFEPFVTTTARGTGLGLAIVRKRVEQLGGTITYVSPVAQARGSRFVVTLPQNATSRTGGT